MLSNIIKKWLVPNYFYHFLFVFRFVVIIYVCDDLKADRKSLSYRWSTLVNETCIAYEYTLYISRCISCCTFIWSAKLTADSSELPPIFRALSFNFARLKVRTCMHIKRERRRKEKKKIVSTIEIELLGCY